jgi:uncharacterized protein
MSDAKPQQEPSMKALIASISRIIAEDGGVHGPVLPAAPGVAEKDDILELTEALDEDGRVHRIAPAAMTPVADATWGFTPGAAAQMEPRLPEPAPPRIDAGIVGPSHGHILGAAALAGLGALPRDRAGAAELPVGGAGRTLEDIVRDALHPLLQSWLDDHLPGIVERLVRDEIARVAGAAGRR